MKINKFFLIVVIALPLVCVSCSDDDEEAVGSTSSGKHMGHEYVDLGLSVKWATCNVGADSPSDYGDYYSWGEVATKRSYSSSNCATDGVHLGNISGDAQYDAARARWGGEWRMPTKDEWSELFDRCRCEWVTEDDCSGYRVTGNNGASIFLPAAGYMSNSSLMYGGKSGYYNSATPYDDEYGRYNMAYDYIFYSAGNASDPSSRYIGMTIRPVSD